MTFHDKVFLLA